MIKLVLDQTIGATLNTLLFSVFNRSLQAAMVDAPRETNVFKAIGFWNSPGAIDFGRVDMGGVWRVALDEFWDIYSAGLKVWPAVSFVNFSLVKSVQTRNLIGGLAGIGWGTYMSLIAAE